MFSLARLRNPGSGEGIGAVTECRVSCFAAGMSSFAGLWLPKMCPARCCAAWELPGLELQAHPATFLLVIKGTDVVPAGFPLIDKGWPGVSCDVDVRLDCGVVSTEVELRGLLPVSGQMGPISNRSVPALSCALSLA